MRLDVAVLQVLLTGWCATTGSLPAVLLWLVCRPPTVFHGPRHPLHKGVASAVLILALLHMLTACTFVTLWKLDTIDRLPWWSYLLLMPAVEDRTALIASLVPPLLSAAYVVLRWGPLTGPRDVAPRFPLSVPRWAAPNIQWTTALAATLYPTTPGMAFMAVTAISIAVRAFTTSARAGWTMGTVLAIVSAAAMCVSFAFQNRYVRHVYRDTDYVVVPFLYDLEFRDGVPFFLHLLFGGAAALVSSWILEMRSDHLERGTGSDEDPSQSLLDNNRMSLYGASGRLTEGSVQAGDAIAVAGARAANESRQSFASHAPVDPNSLRARTDRALSTGFRHARHYLLVVPLLPVILLSAAIAFFPSAVTLAGLPVVLAGLLLRAHHYAKFMVYWVPVLCALIAAQYVVLTLRHALGPTTMRVFFATDETWSRVIEVLVAVVVALLLATSLHAQRAYAVEAERRKKENEERIVLPDEDGAAAGGSPTGGNTSFSVEALQKAQSSTLQADGSSSFKPADRALRAHVGCHWLKRGLREMAILAKEYTYVISLFFAFVAATVRADLDIVHALLLLIFVVFAVVPRHTARRLWPLLVVYVTTLTVYVVTWHYLSAFYTPPEHVYKDLRSSTLGTDTYSSDWIAVPYFVAMFASAIEWRTIKDHRRVTEELEAALEDEAAQHRFVAAIRDRCLLETWSELFDHDFIRRWKSRFGLVLAGGIFVGLAVGEPRSFFVGVFLLLFLIVSLLSAYNAPKMAATVVWYIAAVFSFFAALCVTLYQFRDIREWADRWIDDNQACEGQDPSCAAQVGLTTTSYALAFHLAPWMVAALVALGQARASYEASKVTGSGRSDGALSDAGTAISDIFISTCTSTSYAASAAPAGDGGGQSPPPRGAAGATSMSMQPIPRLIEMPHAAPQRWCREKMFAFVDWLAECALIVARNYSRVLVLGTYVAMLYVETDLLTFVYALFLLTGVTGKGPLAYSMLHLMAIYIYQFTFVPTADWDVDGVDVAMMIGLHKSDQRRPPSSVMVVLACFFANLLWDVASEYTPTRSSMIDFGTLIVEIQRDTTASLGYEVLLCLLIAAFATCEDTIVCFAIAALALAMVTFATASTLLPNARWLAAHLLVLGLTVVGEYLCKVFTQNHALSTAAIPYGKYFGLDPNASLLVTAGAALGFVQCLEGVRELMKSLYAERALAHDGNRNLHEQLAAESNAELTTSLGVMLSASQEELDTFAPPYLGPDSSQPLAIRVSFAVRQVATSVVKHISPYSILAFGYGASRTTVLGAYFVTIGAIAMAYVDHLNTRGYRVWRRLVPLIAVPILLLPPILHVPVIRDYAEGSLLFSALGVTEDKGTAVIEMTAWHALILLSIVFHRRLTEHFYAATMIRELWLENRENAQRAVDVQAKIADYENAQWAEWKRKQDESQRQLDTVRATMAQGPEVVAHASAEPPTQQPQEPSSPSVDAETASGAAAASFASADRRAMGTAGTPTASNRSLTAAESAARLGDPAVKSAKESREKRMTKKFKKAKESVGKDAEKKSEDEEDETPLLEKIKQKVTKAKAAVVAGVAGASAKLADKAYRPSEVRARIQDQPFWIAIPIAAAEALKPLTLELVVIFVFLNGAQSATMWDMLSIGAMALVGVTMYPFPPLPFFLGLMWYTLVGLFSKALCYITVTHTKTEAHTRHVVSSMFIKVPDTKQLAGATITEAFTDLSLDCVLFIVIVLHWHISVRNGLYRREDADLSSLQLVGDEEEPLGTRAKHTAILLGMRYYGRRKGTGHDIYVESTLALALVMIVTCFGYYSIADAGRGSFISSVQADLLPGPMVAFLSLSVFIMVADRAVYVLSDAFKKLILHSVVTSFVVVAVIVWHSLVQKTNFASFLMLFALSVYLCFSGYQIKYGYPAVRRSDPFTPFPESTLRGIGYAIMRGVPFLAELRTLIDFSFTPTTLSFDNWLRVAAVSRIVYERQVLIVEQREMRGKVRPLGDKVGQGMSRLVLLLVLLLFPLVYYSTFNPSMIPNYVTDMQADLSLNNGAQTFTQTIRPPQDYPGPLGEYVSRTRPTVASYNIESKSKTVQLAEMNTCSAAVWPISPQGLRELSAKVVEVMDGGQPLSVGLDVSITRQSSTGEGGLTQHIHHDWYMDEDAATTLSLLLNTTEEIKEYVELKSFYNPIVFNQPAKVQFFDVVAGKPGLGYVDCTLGLRAEADPVLNGTSVRYWCLKCNSLFSRGNFPNSSFPDWQCLTEGQGCGHANYEAHQHKYFGVGMYYVFVSELVPNTFSFIPNMGIIALYTTFVLAVGSFVRGTLVAEPQLLIAEAADPTPLRDLCRYLSAARAERDFELEQRIYLDLIDLLRNPAALLESTGRQRELYDPIHGTSYSDSDDDEGGAHGCDSAAGEVEIDTRVIDGGGTRNDSVAAAPELPAREE